jgi:tRNA threonylcarbamoyladenosine biosynthesis protein TsaE
VVALIGDLGAGKTTLVRGAARALGVTDHVTSPTFTLAQTYQGRLPIAHLDAYRLGQVDEEEAELALAAAGPGAVVFLEWPDALGDTFDAPAITVTIDHTGADGRALQIDVVDDAQHAALSAALAAGGLA